MDSSDLSAKTNPPTTPESTGDNSDSHGSDEILHLKLEALQLENDLLKKENDFLNRKAGSALSRVKKLEDRLDRLLKKMKIQTGTQTGMDDQPSFQPENEAFEQKHLPGRLKNETAQPKQETAVPKQGTTVPKNETIIPKNESITPKNGSTAPIDENGIPRNVTTTPIKETTAPTEETSAPTAETTVPVNETERTNIETNRAKLVTGGQNNETKTSAFGAAFAGNFSGLTAVNAKQEIKNIEVSFNESMSLCFSGENTVKNVFISTSLNWDERKTRKHQGRSLLHYLDKYYEQAARLAGVNKITLFMVFRKIMTLVKRKNSDFRAPFNISVFLLWGLKINKFTFNDAIRQLQISSVSVSRIMKSLKQLRLVQARYERITDTTGTSISYHITEEARQLLNSAFEEAFHACQGN